jgi:hypothetical protein
VRAAALERGALRIFLPGIEVVVWMARTSIGSFTSSKPGRHQDAAIGRITRLAPRPSVTKTEVGVQTTRPRAPRPAPPRSWNRIPDRA